MPLFLVEDSVRNIYILAKDWQAAFTAWSDKVENDFDCAPIDGHALETEPIKKVSMQLLADDREVLIQREIQAEIRNDLASKSEQEERAAKYNPSVSQLRDDDQQAQTGINEPSCKDPWHRAVRRETEQCPSCGFEPELYKRLRESGAWQKSGLGISDTSDAVREGFGEAQSQAGVNDPPINSAIKCPNCESMSYYTDGHHGLFCSVCQYIAPSPK